MITLKAYPYYSTSFYLGILSKRVEMIFHSPKMYF